MLYLFTMKTFHKLGILGSFPNLIKNIFQKNLQLTYILVLSHKVVFNSLRLHGQEPTRLLCPWDSPGKNTGVGCHFLYRLSKVKA